MTEQERTDIRLLQENIKGIRENTACLPELCSMVARHDERIKSLDKIIWWGLGVLGSINVGIILFLVTNSIIGG